VNRSRLWKAAILLLLALCVGPLALLGLACLPVAWRVPVEICQLADGRTFYAAVVPQGAADRAEGALRLYRGDDGAGREFLSVPAGDLVARRPAADAWVLVREDGPTVLGVPRALRMPGRRLEVPESLASSLEELPAKLRADRARLARQVRQDAADPARFAEAGARWERWLERDDSTVLELSDARGRILTVRLSGVVRAERSSFGGTSSGLRSLGSRLARLVQAPPGPWGGGGVGPAILSVLQLAVFSGLFAGLFGCAGAVWMRDWNRHPGWRRRGRELVAHMAGVPGVVWGVVGSGLLIHGFGSALDFLFAAPGGGVRWGGGGLLWSSVTLGAFATPIVLAQALEELDRIPRRWIDILWASGATDLQVFTRLVFPQARRGLGAAILSGMARASGETAPLLLTGALHSSGGILLASTGFLQGLAGGYLHPGALALDPPWGGLDAEIGQPVVACTLLGLAMFCIALDLSASLIRKPPSAAPEVLP